MEMEMIGKMAVKKPKTINTMNHVWDKLMKHIDGKDAKIKIVSKEFNKMLDDLLEEDFFGTEGQCDPRGDHRD